MKIFDARWSFLFAIGILLGTAAGFAADEIAGKTVRGPLEPAVRPPQLIEPAAKPATAQRGLTTVEKEEFSALEAEYAHGEIGDVQYENRRQALQPGATVEF